MSDVTTVAADIRWGPETATAAAYAGWSIVETSGVNDYQGWGTHLLRRCDPADELVAGDAEHDGRADVAAQVRARSSAWAVMAWSYGSCSGCDAYEGRVAWNARPDELHEVFGELIEPCPDESAARMKFSERQGW